MERLGVQDTLNIYGETSGSPMQMGTVQILESTASGAPLDLATIREFYRQRLPHLPMFRHRMERVLGGIDRPVWIEVPDLDVADHILGAELPSPGTDRQLAELVSALFPTPLDMSRPLWDMWVIEGLNRGRTAIFSRMHHAVIDGVRGQQAQRTIFDLTPEAPFTRSEPAIPGAGSEASNKLRLLGGGVVRLAGIPVRLGRTAWHASEAAVRLARARRRHELEGLTAPGNAPHTPFNAPLTGRRGFAFCSLPLDPVKRAARNEAATVNDVVMALVGGVLRRHLRTRDALPDQSLVAIVPVGRSGSEARAVPGNQWEIMIAQLASDEPDLPRRIRRISRSTQAGKAAAEAIGPELWSDLLDVPPALIGVAVRAFAALPLADRQPPPANVTISNTRGPQTSLYMAGARLEGSYAMGPIADGLGLNVTVMGYLDALDIGLAMCLDHIDDPWSLVDELRAEHTELTRRYGEGARSA